MPPATVGPFRLLDPIGEGATGTVFLAERIDFPQRAAVKVFHPAFVLEGLTTGDEAQFLTLLDHPNIVRLIDRAPGYLAMEYVEGQPIDTFCNTRALPQSARIELLLDALDALAHAHRRLIVHCDLKPAHLLVTREGKLKILDLGTATLTGQPGAHTPAYASPEQRTQGRITVATDLYAIGLIARELLTESNKDLEAILNKALAQAPEDRFASAEDFASDLRHHLEGKPVHSRHTPTLERIPRLLRRHKLPLALAATLALVILGSITGVVYQSAKALHEQHVASARLHDLARMNATLTGELYDSTSSLPRAATARNLLLHDATETLNQLSVSASHDPRLALELASEYEQLARIHLATDPKAAQQDLTRGLALIAHRPEAAAQARRLEDLLAQAR